MKLLVTGGAGYVGSVCAAHLVEAGHEVVVLDDLSTGHRDAVPEGARFVEGDLARGRRRGARRAASTACCTSPRSRWSASRCSEPEQYWHGNVVRTLALLDAMRRHDVPRLVFSSTAATYGEPERCRSPRTRRPARPTPTARQARVDHAIGCYARRARPRVR